MTPVKQTSIKLSKPEAIEKLSKLNPENSGKSNPDFFMELLDCYEKFKGLNASEIPVDFFPNLQGKEKVEKEPIIKEIFGLEEKDSLMISEAELLQKASEFSGKSIDEMALEGRVLVAKNEIGRQVQYALGRGKKGTADERIEKTLQLLKDSGQKVSLNRLTQASGSNRKTVEAWVKRNNITFE